jgi:threonine dehydrogenase-like Zn-dependent dehydrogenase
VRLVLDATPGRRGADVLLECAGVPEAVCEGWEPARRGGTFLALGQYTDRGAVPLNPHVITRKQLRIVGSWGFAEKHYLGRIQALRRLAARFDLARLITRYQLEDAGKALADMGAWRYEAGTGQDRPVVIRKLGDRRADHWPGRQPPRVFQALPNTR